MYNINCQRGEAHDEQKAPWLLLSALTGNRASPRESRDHGVFAFQTVLHTIARACMGCVEEYTGTAYTRSLNAVQPICQGLGKTKGSTVVAALFRLNDFLKGFWVDAENADTGNGLDDSTLARPMGIKHA